MRSLTNVYLIGHLAADVEIRQTKNGAPVANFPIAVNRFVKPEGGEKKEVADFHRVVVFGKLAEICAEYLAKGSAVYLAGKLINRSFDDKNGERHYRTEIVASNLSILTWKKSKNNEEQVGIEDLEGVEAELEVVE